MPNASDPHAVGDPLPSWNDGRTKSALCRFVDEVTSEGPRHVPASERIAVFDNDGTLWREAPLYAQAAFAVDRVKALAPAHPEWRSQQPFQAILEGDLETFVKVGKRAILEMLAATHAGNTTEEFRQIVSRWIATARHPTLGRLYTELAYQPMLELMALLEAHGFTNFIVSGGGVEFIRPWVERVYRVPPHRVVGSRAGIDVQERDGVLVLARRPELDLVDDHEGKLVGIHQMIGQRPLAAFGNADGDIEMLRWTTEGDGARFGLLVHHTDAEREAPYDRSARVGRLDRGLNEAQARGWTLVDMKADWKVIHPYELSAPSAGA